MMSLIKRPIVQFVIFGLLLYGIQQLTKEFGGSDPIEINDDVIEHLTLELETEWQVKPDSLILKVAKEKWIEQELLYRIALENELQSQSELVKNAIIQSAEDFILSQVDLREPTDQQLEQFMKTASAVYLTETKISFQQYFFGEDLMFAQKALFDSKEIEIESSETLKLSSMQPERLNRQIASDFGRVFSDSLNGKKATWRGIVPSKFGIHAVIIDSVNEAKVAKLSDVRVRVLTDYRRQQLLSFRDSILMEKKAKTEVVETFE